MELLLMGRRHSWLSDRTTMDNIECRFLIQAVRDCDDEWRVFFSHDKGRRILYIPRHG